MKVLYVGHFDDGSTSRMRGLYIQELLQPTIFKIANIDIPIKKTNKIFRSIGWRLKLGPLINKINTYLLTIIKEDWAYDLVWIDKGVFLQPKIIQKLKENSTKVLHFTPDPAFTYHRSRLFYKALPFYDTCITTKSFEKEMYNAAGAKNIIVTTQGFEPNIHKSYHAFEEKKGIVFIGHYEKNRAQVIQKLIKKYPISLAGNGWKRFAKENQSLPGFSYLGTGLYGKAYAKKLSEAQIGLGFLSKIIPELHTTRTIEIPACGTALITEKTSDTLKIFANDEAIFYDDIEELLSKIEFAFNNKVWLKEVSLKGMNKVYNQKYDYRNILKKIFSEVYKNKDVSV